MTTSITLSNSYPMDHMEFIRSKDMSVDNLKSLYYSLVQFPLTYDTMLWGSVYQYRLHKHETSHISHFKQLGIAKLMDIYNIQQLMYSYITGTLFTQLQIIFTDTSLVRSHQTRHSRDPHSIDRQTSSAARTFIHQWSKAWLALPGDLKNYKSYTNTSKKYYLSTH